MNYFNRIIAFFLLHHLTIVATGQDALSFEQQIDSVVVKAIKQQAFPGCVVYVAKDGNVLFEKSYGFHTYDSIRKVRSTDVYDLASITKVTASTIALMKLYEQGLVELDKPLKNYIGGIGKVGRPTVRECLAHQAGLFPWIPYYQEVKRRNGTYKAKTMSLRMSKGFDYKLSDNLFLHQDFYTRIKKMIRKSEISKTKKYKYSGLFFYLVPELVKNASGLDFETYLESNFYDSLKTSTLGFNPVSKMNLDRIVPTERDTYFRNTLIHGTVHDEGAITMKGVSGNAGLFSNAGDLAKVWQMLLKNGTYEGKKYLNPQTIELFTTAQYPGNDNQRGLGFDKPLLEYDSLLSSVAKSTSFRSYGHSGFTGTFVWVDPERDMLFIFLSNRVYPTRENRGLYRLNVRPAIHQLIYDHIKNPLTD